MISRKVESFQDLVVWQKSHQLAIELSKFKISKKENESLVNMIRDAVILIPLNISIGFRKRSKKAKLHFYRLALTSLQELAYLLILADDLEYIKNYDELKEESETIDRMLKRLIRSNTPNK